MRQPRPPQPLPAPSKDDTAMTSRVSALRSAGPAVLAIGVLGLGVLTTGMAYAYWSTTGTGSASATAGSAQPVSVVVAVAGGTLHPAASLSAAPTFANPNPFPVTVTRVTPGAVRVSGGAGCTADTSGVTFSALTGPWTVPARSGSTDGTVTGPAQPGAVTMESTSDTGCQSATFTAALTVAGTSS